MKEVRIIIPLLWLAGLVTVITVNVHLHKQKHKKEQKK